MHSRRTGEQHNQNILLYNWYVQTEISIYHLQCIDVNYIKIFLVVSKLVLGLPIIVPNQRDIYTTRKEFIATELKLHIMQRKFHEGLLQGHLIGHQLLSVTETYRQ